MDGWRATLCSDLARLVSGSRNRHAGRALVRHAHLPPAGLIIDDYRWICGTAAA
jgi:hypothetical protein